MPLSDRKNKTIVLFNYDWDLIEFNKLIDTWPQTSSGFDLFSFPSNTRLIWFDIERYCSLVALHSKLSGAQAVISNHEQFGALCAAIIAEKMHWPGTPVKAILACQHKLYARQILQKVAPEANVKFKRLSSGYREKITEKIQFPKFVKPLKAAFSVLAKKIESYEELETHTKFNESELWIIKHLVEPFERIFQSHFPGSESAHSLILEEPIIGQHFCLNGYFYKNCIKNLGVVGAVMYPKTNAFMRFEYPSSLSIDKIEEAEKIAEVFMKEIGFFHGMFNMEFIIERNTNKIKVVEFNPRMASQFADLYERVDGLKMHAMALSLAHGLDPKKISKVLPNANCAASFVYRIFDKNNRKPPISKKTRDSFFKKFPSALLFEFPKSDRQMERDFKWTGSYRYGVMHLGGDSFSDLKEKCENASKFLGWESPYID